MGDLWAAFRKLSWWKKALMVFPMLIVGGFLAAGWLWDKSTSKLISRSTMENAVTLTYAENEAKIENIEFQRNELRKKLRKVDDEIDMATESYYAHRDRIVGATDTDELLGIYSELAALAKEQQES